ncbi:MAG: mannose-1-phosphate guanylyltransferase [Deltaproteobacteria bacterium]|nr:mannose-1-phosphate guanylyltransferase [Deltaproteobacteria bacterium]
MSSNKRPLHAIIMAGGKGLRFWPKSRRDLPKQFLPLGPSQKPLLLETLERLLPMIPPERLHVVAGSSHLREIQRIASFLPEKNLLGEPLSRNTAPCLAYALLHLTLNRKMNEEDVVAVLPADHSVVQEDDFRRDLLTAADWAAKRSEIVLLGVKPTRAETGYGYIRAGALYSEREDAPFFSVRQFVEKPDLQHAGEYLRSGEYFWNSGIVISKISTLVSEFEQHLPDLWADLRKQLRSRFDSEASQTIDDFEEFYRSIPPLSFDVGILERSKRMRVMPIRCGWNDLGHWKAVADLYPDHGKEGVILAEKFAGIDVENCIIQGDPQKVISAIGVKDLIIVAVGDAVLVCPKERAQEVKELVDQLEKKGWTEYL